MPLTFQPGTGQYATTSVSNLLPIPQFDLTYSGVYILLVLGFAFVAYSLSGSFKLLDKQLV